MLPRFRHSRFRHWAIFLLAVFFVCETAATTAAFAAPAAPGHVKATLVALDESVQPGQPVSVALKLEHAPHWHTYWLNPGTGYATSLTWKLPDGWRAGEIQWPVPTLIKDAQGNITGNGYEGTVYLPVTLTAPAGLATGGGDGGGGVKVTLRAKAEWLMCSDVCMPGEADVSLTLPVLATAPKAAPLREKALGAPPMPGNDATQYWRAAVATRAPGAKTITLILLPASAGINDAHFFSADGFVQYDQPQPVKIDNDRLVLALPVSDSHEGDGKRLTGVLAFKDANGVYRGRAIDVKLGAPASMSEATGATSENENTHGLEARATRAGSAELLLGEHGLEARATRATRATSGISTGILLLAFLGGLILNLMPCVFPVLGIKILGFVNQAGASRRKVTLHGIAFTAGVLVSFWILAGLLAILRAGGGQLGWGFQLQSPVFVFALAAVMLVFALNMSGVFEFGLGATSLGAGLQDKRGYTGSFFTGALATVAATPCSAPFLAPALGAALAMSAAASFLVFTLIALGLSTPYLLLSIFPGAVKILPRPGAWMETFKQLMAFLLYATVAYLAWVLAGQAGENGFLAALFALVLIAMAAWLYGRYAAPGNSAARRRFGVVGALVLVVCGCWLGWPRAAAPDDIVWEKWSPAAVASAQASGRIVYVDFTARWCATCQANKKIVFGSDEVRRVFREKKILALKADWTNADPQITAELARFNRGAVPFNLIYKPGRPEPVALPELLTPGVVLDALK